MKLSGGQEATILIKDLAPAGKQLLSKEEKRNNEKVRNNGIANNSNQDVDFSNASAEQDNETTVNSIVPDRYVIVDPLDEY